MSKLFFDRFSGLAVAGLMLNPMSACSQVGNTPAKRDAVPVVASIFLPLQGDLPSNLSAAALRVQQMNLPAGASSARIFVQAPGLTVGTIDSSGYVGSVSVGHSRDAPQDFVLRLEPDQVRTLMLIKGRPAEASKATVVIEAVDRTGKSVPGAKAELAVLVDGNQAISGAR